MGDRAFTSRCFGNVRRRTGVVSAAAALMVVTPLAMDVPAASAVDPAVVMAMQSFLTRPSATYPYKGSRRLEATGSGHKAWLDAQTDFSPASGLLYSVTAEGGSGIIRSRVLRSLLEEEKQLIARGGGPAIAISTANYAFTPEGMNEEGLAVVGMRPLRKEKSLIEGRLFLTPEGDLRRIEGRLAKSPSFWVKRAQLVRTYRRLNGVLMPVSLETTAQLRLLGSSSLRMTYRYSHIDERPVDAEQVD